MKKIAYSMGLILVEVKVRSNKVKMMHEYRATHVLCVIFDAEFDGNNHF